MISGFAVHFFRQYCGVCDFDDRWLVWRESELCLVISPSHPIRPLHSVPVCFNLAPTDYSGVLTGTWTFVFFGLSSGELLFGLRMWLSRKESHSDRCFQKCTILQLTIFPVVFRYFSRAHQMTNASLCCFDVPVSV